MSQLTFRARDGQLYVLSGHLEVQQVRPPAGGGISDPTEITGCKAWYDASDITTLWQESSRTTQISADGQTVGAIDDKSGNANHATQADTAREPTYKAATQNGLSVLRFLAGPYNLKRTFAANLSQPYTIFGVGGMDAANNNQYQALWDGPNATNRAVFYQDASVSPDQWTIDAGTVVRGSSTDTAWHVFIAVHDGANSKLYIDGGTADISGNAGSQSLGGLTLGNNQQASTSWRGNGGEWGVYNSALSTTDLNSLGNYLATRWGTTWVDI